MAVDAFTTNFSGMTERVAAKPAKVEPMIQTAELDFKNGWASDLATRQLFNVNGYATLGGKTVTHGAAGFDTRTGAYGIRPIYMPGTR